MRTVLALTILGALAHWINEHLDTCQLVGHDAHWTRCGTVRECQRCHHTWLAQIATPFNPEIGHTTSNGEW